MGLKENSIFAIAFVISIMLSEDAFRSQELDAQIITLQNRDCNIFYGSWVRNPNPTPLYEGCVLVNEAFNCHKSESYMLQRWQPSSCDLPKFQAGRLLEAIRGKRIMFVGDTMSYNQWQSFICMLDTWHGNYSISENDSISLFHVFDVAIHNDRSRPYLVDIEKVPGRGTVLKLDSMMRGQMWKGQDVLIFNMWELWHNVMIGHPWDYIQIGNEIVRRMNRLVALEKVLRTWARWVDENIVPSRTKVFFVGVLPNHRYGHEWGNETAANCGAETEPVTGSRYPGGPDPMEDVVKKVLRSVKEKIFYLDVTLLSQLRKDGHPCIYNSHGLMDCDHWCLPGVPDTWNELLSAVLLDEFSTNSFL